MDTLCEINEEQSVPPADTGLDPCAPAISVSAYEGPFAESSLSIKPKRSKLAAVWLSLMTFRSSSEISAPHSGESAFSSFFRALNRFV